MKAVQLLYSYLLVEKPFSLESQPSSPTKEKRFAYNLYLDLIYLLVRIANQVKGKNRSLPLTESRFIIRCENDEKIKSLKVKYEKQPFPFSSVESLLADSVKYSLLFRELEKISLQQAQTDNFWEDVFNSIIITNSTLIELINQLPGYSLSGVDRMREMMDITFKNFYSSQDNLSDVVKTLELSMQKSRDLYMRLLALPVEITEVRLKQLEYNKRKLIKSEGDLNPNMKLVDNQIPSLINSNPEFSKYIEKNKLSWQMEDPELLEILLNAILESEIYNNYLLDPESSLSHDSDFWRDIIVDVILNNKDFLEYLENKSVFWNDDLEIIGSFVLKTIKRFDNPETRDTAVLPMFKDGENGRDAHFGSELISLVIKNKDLYRRYIEEALAKDKWETDRLAFMDIIITMTALAEILNYPDIPIPVSVNEYIEIAKSYSSEKSGQFINGLLASILPKLNLRK